MNSVTIYSPVFDAEGHKIVIANGSMAASSHKDALTIGQKKILDAIETEIYETPLSFWRRLKLIGSIKLEIDSVKEIVLSPKGIMGGTMNGLTCLFLSEEILFKKRS